MNSSADQIRLRRIVSGGQTGVDRGALDAAITLGLEHGGWCPQGRRAEDGSIPAEYQMRETASQQYPVRTRKNVADSDGTLLLYRARLQAGTELTYRCAQELDKPFLLVDLEAVPEASFVVDWVRDAQIETLNVAGPRESSAPGIARQACEFLSHCLASAVENC